MPTFRNTTITTTDAASAKSNPSICVKIINNPNAATSFRLCRSVGITRFFHLVRAFADSIARFGFGFDVALVAGTGGVERGFDR